MADRPSRKRSSLRRRSFLAGVGGAVTALAGCLVHGEDSGLRGTIVIDGSNTVAPHSMAIAEEFLWKNNRVNIPIVGSGTGAGFQQFCQGASDIQNASRRITDDEHEQCTENGVEYIELTALRDGIALFCHPNNDWADHLTVNEIRDIWHTDSTVETWADVRDEWPDREIDLFGRDPASGTFDFFTKAITGEVGNIRDDYSATADTNVIVDGVRGSRDALGWGGAGFFYENEDDLKLLGVDDPDGPIDGPVTPTRETIEAETYTPLTRWMYAYVRAPALEREVVREFMRFYFEEIDERAYETAYDEGFADPDEQLTWTQWAARRVGFYAADDETVEQSRQTLEEHIEQYA